MPVNVWLALCKATLAESRASGTVPLLVDFLVDAAVHDQPEAIRENLARQLYSPVQWVQTVQAMGGRGISRIVEAGPGKVLAGLCKRIDKSIATAAVYDPDTLDAALAD